MNKARLMAAARLAEAQAELEVLERAMPDAIQARLDPFYTNDRIVAIARLIERAQRNVRECEARAKEKQEKSHCRWQWYNPVIKGKAEIHVGYTSDADGDGNYWCKWYLCERLGTTLGIRTSYQHWVEERSFRTRKAAINRALKVVREYAAKKTIRLPKQKIGPVSLGKKG